MKQEIKSGCSRRERLETAAVALFPAALGLLAPMVMLAGRLAWLSPVLALPLGLGLRPVWERLGEKDLGRGLEEAFGRLGGKLSSVLYFFWALALLVDAARRYSERLLTISEGEKVRWLFLLSALILCLWLGRGNGGIFVRTGRLFLLAVGVTAGIILLLALPGVEWRNLWPPEQADWRELPGAAALCLSLAGYGVYVLCLSRQKGKSVGKHWHWTAGGCAALAAVLFIIVGTFGPTLTGQLGDPFLFLLEGVRVPGAFRRGGAGLVAVLALADLALLTLLSRGAMTLWRGLISAFSGLAWAPVAAAFVLAGILPGWGRAWGRLAAIIPVGNLIFGILLPVLSVLTIRVREHRKKQATFCGNKFKEKADVAVKQGGKKSGKENEKKC